eukprot:scaffold99557_cov33-Tisochrysis_lutea.AAC.4
MPASRPSSPDRRGRGAGLAAPLPPSPPPPNPSVGVLWLAWAGRRGRGGTEREESWRERRERGGGGPNQRKNQWCRQESGEKEGEKVKGEDKRVECMVGTRRTHLKYVVFQGNM